MEPAARAWARRIGAGLAVAGSVWVGLRLLRYRGDLAAAPIPAAAWLTAGAGAAVLAAANVLLALAWRALLARQGARRTAAWCIRTQGLSQLAKYVPGNVAHFASRHLLGAAAGAPHGALVRSTLHELAGLAVAGCLLGVWALPLAAAAFDEVAPAAGVGAALLALVVVRRIGGAPAARALAAYLLFLLAAGLVFRALLVPLAPDADRTLSWTAACGAYTAAWLAGFVTPGAPAGLGVREAALLFLLRGHGAEAELLPVIVLSRAVTVVGDALFFGAAACVRPRPGDGAPPAGRATI